MALRSATASLWTTATSSWQLRRSVRDEHDRRDDAVSTWCPSEPGRFGGRRPRDSSPLLAGSVRRRAVTPARLTMPARRWWDADRLRGHMADANDGIIAVAGVVEGLTGAGGSAVVVCAAVVGAGVAGAGGAGGAT